MSDDKEVARKGASGLSHLLSAEDLSEMLQIPVQTIYRWRHRGEGPRPMKVGKYLRFDPEDVTRWLEARRVS